MLGCPSPTLGFPLHHPPKISGHLNPLCWVGVPIEGPACSLSSPALGPSSAVPPPLPWYSCSGQALAPLTSSSAARSLVSLDWVALRRCCSWLVLRSRMHRWDTQVSRHPWQWPRPWSCALTVLSAARLRSMLIPMPKPRVPSTQHPSESILFALAFALSSHPITLTSAGHHSWWHGTLGLGLVFELGWLWASATSVLICLCSLVAAFRPVMPMLRLWRCRS